MRKRIIHSGLFFFALVLLLLSVRIPSIQADGSPYSPFTDVRPGAWYFDAVLYVTEHDLGLEPPEPAPDRHHIPWQFLTYLDPTFSAAIQETLAPQTVEVLQRRDDGWALIVTARGDRWVYLRANMRYIERAVFLYDRVDGRPLSRLAPQVVTILAQEGDWLQISTWLGPRWIYLDQAPLPDGKLIALTFDDGPHIAHTPRLLNALYARGVPATFFVLGQQVERAPALARRITAEGHEIANHSFSHPELTRRNAASIRDELYRTSSAIYRATGTTPALMRPPYGAHNATVRSVAAEFGYPVIHWSVDTLDWQSRNVNAIMSHFVDRHGNVRIREGDIILMHDLYGTTVDAAIRAIDLLLAEGFTFVTVSDLLLARYETLVPGRVYSSSY